jgi:predicted lipoprotein with Yx(FWY)xxD motif
MAGVELATIDGGEPMRTSSRRAALVVALVGVVGMSAGACGSSTTDTGSSGAAGSSSTTASTGAGGSTGTTVAEGTTPAGPVDLVVVSTPYGDAIGTDDGLVLYTWDKEADGTVACTDAACVEKWPPLLADAIGDVGDLDPMSVTLIERPDGTSQVAIEGRPVYHMAVDEPGEATCQGAEGWWILNPDGTKNTNETPRSATTSTVAADVPGY